VNYVLTFALLDACTQSLELVLARIADCQIVFNTNQRLVAVENRMPSTPLLGVQEAEARYVELILEQSQVSVAVPTMLFRALQRERRSSSMSQYRWM
jgi:hypothetical protein